MGGDQEIRKNKELYAICGGILAIKNVTKDPGL